MTNPSSAVRMRPFARLLTMLGEQLIKNDRIALVELIKNSYDADATAVEIRFENFGPDLETQSDSRIVITDNGDGMTRDVVENHWLNPATDVKAAQKSAGRARTRGGRVIQGEKGIGRFAMFKLGSTVALATRARGEDSETSTTLDIAFLDEDGDPGAAPAQEPVRYLDELEAHLTERDPEIFIDGSDYGTQGTQLTIGALRSKWSREALMRLHEDLMRLQPLRGLITGDAGEDPHALNITYLVNGQIPDFLEDPEAVLDGLAPRAVLKVVGTYESESNSFDFEINDEHRNVPIASPEILGLALYSRFVSKKREPRQFECGDFAFEFLVFDIRQTGADLRHELNPVEKNFVRDRRIYLYRDGVRVLPYGDPDDDWLQLDVIRGTVRANSLLSNDQTIGFVYISQENNPHLRDKTNREGLIDAGPAYNDFRILLQLFVNYLRKGDFERYLSASRVEKDTERRRQVAAVDARLKAVRALLRDDSAAAATLDEFAEAYAAERRVMRERVERTEDLAGVGMSVETASHDIVATANQAFREAKILVEQLGYELGRDHEVSRRARQLTDSISFIVSRLQDVQGLFVSSRRRAKKLDVVQYVRKIESIYSRALRDAAITVEYAGDLHLEATTHDATLLQVFLNLVDNAIYWLDVAKVEDPTISLTIDAGKREVLFEDNGPGINHLDVPYVFEPFFSAKGDEGRGLGLYIARQVARRDGFELELVTPDHPDERVPAKFRFSVGES